RRRKSPSNISRILPPKQATSLLPTIFSPHLPVLNFPVSSFPVFSFWKIRVNSCPFVVSFVWLRLCCAGSLRFIPKFSSFDPPPSPFSPQADFHHDFLI